MKRSRETCLYKGRLAQFEHRADVSAAWEERWKSADLEKMYHWAGEGALGVYRRSFLKYLPREEVVGIEWERQILKRVKRVWPDAPLMCGDVRHFPLADQSVDAVISLGVIEHFEDPWEALRDTVRILRPGGLLYLVVPYVNYLRRLLAALGRYPERTSGDQFYQFLLSDAEISSALRGMGFEVEASFATSAFAGLRDEFPWIGKIVERLPYAHYLINGLDKLRLCGPFRARGALHCKEEKGLS